MARSLLLKALTPASVSRRGHDDPPGDDHGHGGKGHDGRGRRTRTGTRTRG